MWAEGDVIVRREVLNDGSCWLHCPVLVVQDTPELLITYLAEDTEFTFPPTARPHPWGVNKRWQGHGTLMLQRPGEMHAIWLFWDGPNRDFAGWYVNIQEPFRRTEAGYDTQDLELDIWIPEGGSWEWKDDELLEERVREGRFTADQVEVIRTEGRRVADLLDDGHRWWDESWADWRPV
jgi:hypothetical protein